MSRNDDHIYLSAVREGDHWKVVDQHGRRVHGGLSITVEAPYDEAVTVTLKFIDASQTSDAVGYVPRPERK